MAETTREFITLGLRPTPEAIPVLSLRPQIAFAAYFLAAVFSVKFITFTLQLSPRKYASGRTDTHDFD